jgi:hypothetical protein
MILSLVRKGKQMLAAPQRPAQLPQKTQILKSPCLCGFRFFSISDTPHLVYICVWRSAEISSEHTRLAPTWCYFSVVWPIFLERHVFRRGSRSIGTPVIKPHRIWQIGVKICRIRSKSLLITSMGCHQRMIWFILIHGFPLSNSPVANEHLQFTFCRLVLLSFLSICTFGRRLPSPKLI